MRRPGILLVGLLALPGAPQNQSQLLGMWTLAGRTLQGREYRDPRWTCQLEFEPERFALSSLSAQELHLQGADGSGKTRTVQAQVDLRGTWRQAGERLELRPTPPLSAGQSAFAREHFGEPDSKGCYRCPLQFNSGLRLGQLRFERRKRPLPPSTPP